MSYPITDIDGIDVDIAARLRCVGIRTSERLLEAARDAKGRKAMAAATGVDEKLLLRFANMADRLRIKGLGKDYAELLRAAGVETVRELKHRNARRLADAIAAANAERRLVKSPPSEKVVARWIDAAKAMKLKITY